MNHLIRNIFLISLVIVALAERLWFDLGWNVELVTAVTVLAALYGGKRWSMYIPLFVMALSDLFMGNTNIALFTWSAYALAGFVVGLPVARIKQGWAKIVFSFGAGIGISLWFFLWTNFGVWVLDSWGMYPHTLQGLIMAYINGLPFLRNQIIGNMLMVPVITASMELAIICVQKVNKINILKSKHLRLKLYVSS